MSVRERRKKGDGMHVLGQPSKKEAWAEKRFSFSKKNY
jgi:hypothetical protein